MKQFRFKHAPFDVAPQAPRYTATAWRTLGAGVLVLLVCAWPLARSLQELQRAQETQNQARAERQAQANAQRTTQARLSDPMMAEKIKAQQRLQQMVRMSWFGLFDALEAAAQEVRGGVSLLTLTPSQSPTGHTQVRLTALAANAPLMLEYVRALRKDPRIITAELTSQQADDNVGPGVIRMQLTALWDPHAVVPSPAVPADKTEPPGLVAGNSLAKDPVARVVVKETAP